MEHSLKVLFWNINGKGNENDFGDFKDRFAILQETYNPMVVAFAESNRVVVDSMKGLGYDQNQFIEGRTFDYRSNFQASIHWNSRVKSEPLIQARWLESNNYRLQFLELTFKEFKAQGEVIQKVILLVFVHLLDALNHTQEERLIYSIRVREQIERKRKEITKEDNLNISVPAIIMGDFNMNPYDTGMTCVDAFCSVPNINQLVDTHRDSRGKRITREDYFINPFWKYLDQSSYALKTKPPFNALYKHVIDQVLYSPELEIAKPNCCPVFEAGGLITTDHLPIFASFTFL